MKEFDTVFKQTKQFHKIGGTIFPDKPKQPTKDEIRLGLGLITEELIELFRDGFGLGGKPLEALEDSLRKSVAEVSNIVDYNPTQAIDAIADIVVVVSRLGGVLGFDVDKANEIVFRSNLSKFTKDYSVAVESTNSYKLKGVEAYVANVGEWFVVKRASDDKILKVASFVEPDFSGLM